MQAQPGSSDRSLAYLLRESRLLRQELATNMLRLEATLGESKTTMAECQQSMPYVERRRPEHPMTLGVLDSLTHRELEVLRLVAEGHSTKDIAHTLGITFKTAVCHRSRILQKLDAHESATLVRLAIRAGLIEP